MTEKEVFKTIMVIRGTYQNFEKYCNDKSEDEIKEMIAIWYSILESYDATEVALGLKNFITTDSKGFAPSIGQIINCMNKPDKYSQLDELQAWELVRKALNDSAYNATSRFEALPDIVKRVVGGPSQLMNWGLTDISSVETVIQSNFLRCYRSVVAKEEELKRLPLETRTLIEQRIRLRDKSMEVSKNQEFIGVVDRAREELEGDEVKGNHNNLSRLEQIDKLRKSLVQGVTGKLQGEYQ